MLDTFLYFFCWDNREVTVVGERTKGIELDQGYRFSEPLPLHERASATTAGLVSYPVPTPDSGWPACGFFRIPTGLSRDCLSPSKNIRRQTWWITDREWNPKARNFNFTQEGSLIPYVDSSGIQNSAERLRQTRVLLPNDVLCIRM